MKNSHRIAFLLSLIGAAKSHANGPALNFEPQGPRAPRPLISKPEIEGLFKDGILRYEPRSHSIHILSEDMQILQSTGEDKRFIKSIRDLYGSDILINEVSPLEMSLSTQDRGS